MMSSDTENFRKSEIAFGNNFWNFPIDVVLPSDARGIIVQLNHIIKV